MCIYLKYKDLFKHITLYVNKLKTLFSIFTILLSHLQNYTNPKNTFSSTTISIAIKRKFILQFRFMTPSNVYLSQITTKIFLNEHFTLHPNWKHYFKRFTITSRKFQLHKTYKNTILYCSSISSLMTLQSRPLWWKSWSSLSDPHSAP